MLKEREILLKQLKSDYISSTWFPPLQDAIEGLTYDQAVWKPNSNSNSILDISFHLLNDNDWWISTYNAKESIHDEKEEKSEKNWPNIKLKLNGIYNEWEKIITESTNEKLDTVVSSSDDRKWWELISYEMIHTSYHIGQIILLRKLQDVWTNKY